jgi:hypothetical protein
VWASSKLVTRLEALQECIEDSVDIGAPLSSFATHIKVAIGLKIVSGLCSRMSIVKNYLAAIGRRGGIKSRRTLEPEIARRMVGIREARRIARRAAPATALDGTPVDTSVAAQAVQDALLRHFSPAEKLARVAHLSRMTDWLSLEGLKQRHRTADDEQIRNLRAELRLGQQAAARVYGQRADRA